MQTGSRDALAFDSCHILLILCLRPRSCKTKYKEVCPVSISHTFISSWKSVENCIKGLSLPRQTEVNSVKGLSIPHQTEVNCVKGLSIPSQTKVNSVKGLSIPHQT